MTMPSPTPYTVLIVDDNPQLLAVVAAALRHLGHFEVFTAKNGIEGLEQCVALRPDCMVVDVRMPGLDGYQLIRAIRGDPATMDTPLVMLTAMAQDKDRFSGMAAGADQYLLKPLKPTELVAAIQRAITLSRREREERQRDLLRQSEQTEGEWRP